MRRSSARCALVILFASYASASCCYATADDDSISTDRPDFVDSSDVVKRGVVQIETGVGYERNQVDPATRTFTTPTLVRYGLISDLELRVDTDGRIEQETVGAIDHRTERGFSDLSLGLKWHVRDGASATHRTAIAFELSAEFPSGSNTFKGESVRPTLRAIAEWEFAHSLSLGVMSGAVYDRSSTHRFWSGLLATSAGLELTENLRGFAEFAGQQFAHADDGGVLATLDTGLAYLLTKSIQIDCAIYRGVNRNTSDWSFGAGISLRL